MLVVQAQHERVDGQATTGGGCVHQRLGRQRVLQNGRVGDRIGGSGGGGIGNIDGC